MTTPASEPTGILISKSVSKCLWAILIIVLICIFSCCGYFIYFNQIPSAPVPESANLISRSSRSSAMRSYWYYETYVVDISEEDAIAFYQNKDARCSEILVAEFSIPAPYIRCELDAKPFGWAGISIFTQDSQTKLFVEIRWEPADTRIEELFD